MASAGPNNPGTLAHTAVGGSLAWADASDSGAPVVGDLSASGGAAINNALGSLFGSTESHRLSLTNFGFSIPTGATINGIVVEARVKNQNAGVDFRAGDLQVQLIVGGSTSGSDKADATIWGTGTNYGTYIYKIWGGASDPWGLTPSVAQINASNFGIALRAKALAGGYMDAAAPNIDHVRITVYYTVASSIIEKDADEALGVSITEGRSIAATLARSDAAGLSTVEATALSVTLSTTDGVGLALGDVATILASVATTDALGAALSESAAVAAIIATADALGLSAAEAYTIAATLTQSDAATLTVIETPTIDATLSGADAASLIMSEAYLIGATLLSTDAVAMSLGEDASLTALLTVADALGLSVIEAVAIIGIISQAEAIGLSVSEVVTIAVTVATVDALGASSVMTGTPVDLDTQVEKDSSDAIGVAASESAVVAALLDRLDSLGVSLIETPTLAVTLDHAEALGIGASEAIAIIAMLSGNDDVSPALAEAAALAAALARSDAAGIGTSEQADIDATLLRAEMLAISISSSGWIFTNTETDPADAAGAGVVESYSLLVIVSATDGIDVGAAEGDEDIDTDVPEPVDPGRGWRTSGFWGWGLRPGW